MEMTAVVALSRQPRVERSERKKDLGLEAKAMFAYEVSA